MLGNHPDAQARMAMLEAAQKQAEAEQRKAEFARRVEERLLGEAMKIGTLRHYITIQSKEAASGAPAGDRGQPTTEWGTLYSNVPASVVTLSGRELEEARQLLATADYRVTLRYHADIGPRDRVLFDGRALEIGHIDNVEQRSLWLVLLCSEVK